MAFIEFIVSNHIKVHPLALLQPEIVDDPAARRGIEELTAGYSDKPQFFVDAPDSRSGDDCRGLLSARRDRATERFKTNEFANPLGGRAFEPHEENPMIGFRGASRYTHPAYADGFALECAAMKRVRDDMGLVNVKLMIPFCRRVAEAERVLQAMAGLGLGRGVNGLEIYGMCEIPNNVIQIDAFSRLFDGFSIGSNDLTQLVLGVDRDSEIVDFDFDERDEGVKAMIRQTIEGARRNHRHAGICGQAPSDYPEMAEYLVELGIDSISVTPDTLLEVTRAVLAVEARLGRIPRVSDAAQEPS